MPATPTPATLTSSGADDHVATLSSGVLVLAFEATGATSWRTVGRYADYGAATRAHIDDTLDQLERNDGWLLTCEHLLIGPDVDGRISCWPQVVSLGADPRSDRVPDPYDRQAWATWLEHIHGLTDLI